MVNLRSNHTMSAIGISANKLELLQVANAVAQEKSIDKSIVLSAIEEAIQKAARSNYGRELDIKANINPQTGVLSLYRCVTVVEQVENENTEVSLEEAKKEKPDVEIGYVFKDELPPVDFGRVASQTAKQVILQKVREAERDRQYEDFKDRMGEIISCIVRRVEYGNVIVDLGQAEGIIRRDQMIPRENLQQGDRVKAYLYDVKRELRGPQIFLSRAHPQFMAALFAQEVPEIYEGVIEIISVARDPGSRAKIAVYTRETSLDPVGACVGMRGSRVQAVVSELQGERIDIIPWSEDPANFIVNTLQPAEVSKVVIDEDEHRTEIVVPDNQLSLAIGRRGQNVRLATELTGWNIDIMTEQQESERRQKEFQKRTEIFMSAMDVDEMIAQLLASEGFENIEEVAYVAPNEIASIEGFDEEMAQELQNRAREYIEEKATELKRKYQELGVQPEILELDGITDEMVIALGENEIKSLEDFAGLAVDDLKGWNEQKNDKKIHFDGIWEEFKLSFKEIEGMILKSRIKLGWIPPDEQEEEQVEPTENTEEISDKKE